MTILFRPHLVFLFHHIAIPHDFFAFYRHIQEPIDSGVLRSAAAEDEPEEVHPASQVLPFGRHRGDRQVSKVDDVQKDLISFRNAKIMHYS